MFSSSVFGTASDTGLVRANNEDSYLFLRSREKGFVLLIIADGMGGHNCGEDASRIAVQYSSYVIENSFNDSMSDKQILDMLGNAAEAANIQVNLEARLHPEKYGMGTTLSVALIFDDKIYISHVGDTRIYLLRDHRFYQLTRDDTYVQDLVDIGELSPEQAMTHPKSNLLTKAIGSPDNVNPELLKYKLANNDRILLCSDGLYDVLTAREIKNYLERSSEPNDCARVLIEKTLEKGAPDNVTAIVGFI